MNETKALGFAIDKLTLQYQKLMRDKAKAEGVWLKGPTKEATHQIIELDGNLKGLKYAIHLLEKMAGENELRLMNRDIH